MNRQERTFEDKKKDDLIFSTSGCTSSSHWRRRWKKSILFRKKASMPSCSLHSRTSISYDHQRPAWTETPSCYFPFSPPPPPTNKDPFFFPLGSRELVAVTAARSESASVSSGRGAERDSFGEHSDRRVVDSLGQTRLCGSLLLPPLFITLFFILF